MPPSKGVAVPPKPQGSRTTHKPAAKQNAQTRPANPRPVAAQPASNPPANRSGSRLAPVKSASKGAVKVVKKAHGASFDSKFAPRQRPIKSVIVYRHVIAAEFWIGLILILTKPDTTALDAAKTPGPVYNAVNKIAANTLIEAAAFMLVEAVLFGVTSTGREGARIAVGFNTLILLTLATQQARSGRFLTAKQRAVGNAVSGIGAVVGATDHGLPTPPDGPPDHIGRAF